jgi:nucleotide-binding universal stress UspA family protein
LCPVDFSACSRRALEYAVRVGHWYGASVTALHVVPNLHVIDPVPGFPGQPLVVKDLDLGTMRAMLETFVRGTAPGSQVATDVLAATASTEAIVSHAAAIGADLIVMGTHGRSGIDGLLLGSVAERVIRRTACPVMLVPPGARGDGQPLRVPFCQIVWAVDFASTSRRAFDIALELAEEADAHLTLLHAIEVPPELRAAVTGSEVDVPAVRAAAEADILQHLRDLVPAEARTYCKIHTDVREGRADRAIVETARERQAELIVMGVHSGNALDRLLFGSNAHAVLRVAACPVLAVPPIPRMQAVAA